MQSIRYAFRQLRKHPGTTISIILVLALGIGANTAIFSILNPLLLRKLPVQRPDELVRIGAVGSIGPLEISELQSFYKYREQSQVFSGVLAVAPESNYEIMHNGEVDSIEGQIVSGNYFSVLGVQPIAGRTFTLKDEQGDRVAVLSYEYWRRAFGANPATIGQTLQLNNALYTIVGVAPPTFFGLEVGKSPDLYLPLTQQGSEHTDWVQIFGRLRPGISLIQATAALEPVFADIVRNSSIPKVELEQWMNHLSLTDASRGDSELRSQYRLAVLILLTVVVLILFIACANVSNLMLSRTIARRKEFALKQALGAERWTLIRQLLIEIGLMSSLAALVGFLLGRWVRFLLIMSISSARVSIVLPSVIDLNFLLFAVVMLTIIILLCGLVPVLSATRLELVCELKVQSVFSARAGHSRLSTSLIVGQVAVSLAVLVGGSLLLRSLVSLETHDVGFDRGHVLLVSLNLAPTASQQLNVNELDNQLLDRLKSVPGTRSAAFSAFSPISGREVGLNVVAEGYGLRSGDTTHAFFVSVSPGYFQTLGIPIQQGRDFDWRDTRPSSGLAVINESMARYLFGSKYCLGRRFKLIEGNRSLEIIGVVQDSKYNDLRESATNFFYMPSVSARQTLEIRTNNDPRILMSSVRAIIASVSGAFNVGDIKTLREQVDESLQIDRLITMLCGSFGILALVLTCVGLYGLISFRIAQRTKEVGIRMALGAHRGRILRLVVGEGLFMTGIGIALGSIGAAAAAWILRKILFGIGAADPVTMVTVPLLLIFSTIIACYVPARRAAKVDPIVALRYE